MRLLVNEDTDINCVDFFGRTPAYWAAFFTYDKIVAYLVEKGADLSLLTHVCLRSCLYLDRLVFTGRLDELPFNSVSQPFPNTTAVCLEMKT